MSTTTATLETTLTRLSQHLAGWQSRFPEPIDDIAQLAQGFTAKLARLSHEELRLSIGIMGQVKAGKSSFLNALLFEGHEVLPVAATPKTANLTRISYGATPQLTVTFYTPAEWAAIEAAAAGPGQHPEAKVARELLKMAASHGLDVAAVLTQGEQCIAAADVAGLMNQLNDYVGENGRLTALVKATTIALPLAELQGYDVVDTPGMNDPVPSRTQKTREYMAECDVVFFLSRCSQFLDQSDTDLLARQLPGNGVKRMVLVAGQFDGALADDGYNRPSLQATERNLRTRLSHRAQDTMSRLADTQAHQGNDTIAALLRSLQTPIFASTYAHAFATQPAAQWGQSLQHMHGQLSDMADSTWDGYCFTGEDWTRIANFEALKAAYHAARADKQALLQAQREGLLPETRAELHSRLHTLIQAVESRAAQLRRSDMQSIERDLQACTGRIQCIAAQLAEVMDGTRRKARASQTALQTELTSDAHSASQLATRTGSISRTTSREVSTSKWYNPFSWGDTETVYHTYTESYTYLASADAIEKLVQFSVQTRTSLQREFNRLVSLPTLRADLKRSLLQAIDTQSEGFDAAVFRSTLEGTLNHLTLPTLQLANDDPGSAISAQFSGEVRSEQQMQALRDTQQRVINDVLARLLASFDAGVDALCSQLDLTRDALADKFAADLQQEHRQLQQAFADKARELQVYEEIISVSRAALPDSPPVA